MPGFMGLPTYESVSYKINQETNNYPTQKPESLIERIISANTNPGDIVCDFFTVLELPQQSQRNLPENGFVQTWANLPYTLLESV